MTDMTQNKTAPSVAGHKNATPDQATMLHKKIKDTWSKLSDDDVKLYTTQPDQFFMKLKNTYHVEKADAEKQISESKKAAADKSNNSGKSLHAA